MVGARKKKFEGRRPPPAKVSSRQSLQAKMSSATAAATAQAKPSLKDKLLAAKKAYFTGGQPIMTDEEYDALEAQVKREDPSAAAALDATGWTPDGDTVRLPVPLPSLSKGKFGERALERFLATKKGPYVMSDKLDGVSALWDSRTGRLYNRGNGTLGSDLTAYVPQIAGLVLAGAPHYVRGEIVMRKAHATAGTPARSQVNGWLHNERATTVAPADALPLRFVAYQICAPAGVPRGQHFKLLAAAGYEVPWNVTTLGATQDGLAAKLLERRAASEYDIDGLVVAQATSTEAAVDGDTLPTEAFAFKMALDDQRAETAVREVEWNISRQGVYIPRVAIEPVQIGGATISFVTGHNAKFVVDNGIAPGARVTIRRSGDVIPIIEGVIVRGVPRLPAGDWDGVNIRAPGETPEECTAKLDHSLKTLGVEGAGPAAAKALVEAGLRSVAAILKTDDGNLCAVLGRTLGPRVKERLAIAVRAAPLDRLILACPAIPRGFGKSKVTTAFAAYPNWDSWMVGTAAPAGWSADSWTAFLACLPAIRGDVEEWRRLCGVSAAVAVATGGGAGTAAADDAPIPIHGSICMSGFRDQTVVDVSHDAGYALDANLKKTTSCLIVPDSIDPAVATSGKIAKAREYGVPVMRRSDWFKKIGHTSGVHVCGTRPK